MLNTDAVRRTIEAIKASPEKYYQGDWMHPCGSPACIAGFACTAHGYSLVEHEDSAGKLLHLAVAPGQSLDDALTVREQAEALLGLELADPLFQGGPFGNNPPSAADAIATLEALLLTGTVRWHRA